MSLIKKNGWGNKFNPADRKLIGKFNDIRDESKRYRFCHAPFKTLTFFHDGIVIPCFYNKNEALGKFPADNIMDIWNGTQLNTLQKHIKHNDLHFGCHDCARHLKRENFYSVGAWKYDYLPEQSKEKSKWPVSFDFQILNTCNLQCIMCNGEYSTGIREKVERKDPYSSPYNKDFLDQLSVFLPHLKEVSFTGGETFLINVYYEIWERIAEINPDIRISVTTNATVLNDRIRNILNKLKFNITFSIDSIEKNTYEAIRKNADLEKTLQNIEYFKEYTQKTNTEFTLKICPIRQNINEIPSMFDYWNKKSITIIFNTVTFPPYCSLWNLSSDKLQDIYSLLENHKFEDNNKIQRYNIERYSNLKNQIKSWRDESIIREKKKLHSKSIEELKECLMNNISTHVADFSPDNAERLIHMGENMFSKLDNNDSLKRSLIYFNHLPVERLIAEMEVRDLERIRERVFQAGIKIN